MSQVEFKPGDRVRTLFDFDVKHHYGDKVFERVLKAGTIGTVKRVSAQGSVVRVVFGFATLALGEEQAADKDLVVLPSAESFMPSELELV